MEETTDVGVKMKINVDAAVCEGWTLLGWEVLFGTLLGWWWTVFPELCRGLMGSTYTDIVMKDISDHYRMGVFQSCIHVSRKANQVAHLLASCALNYTIDCTSIDAIPSFIASA
ncbi:hypothetical protein TIFTF001_004939 [Ficus carica]|uniref:Uncharacterized protein n=1 Tax=Ficus carica TaxID=3494 RepID=A0AA88DDV6_FICCA|nr:hypothetical protein TIFTF001_004939 [Ficus carica]